MTDDLEDAITRALAGQPTDQGLRQTMAEALSHTPNRPGTRTNQPPALNSPQLETDLLTALNQNQETHS